MFSEEFKNNYYNKICNILGSNLTPTEDDVLKIIKQDTFSLEDLYLLIRAKDNQRTRELVNEASISLRVTKWKNNLFLVPPLYVTDVCINDCYYCPWRRSNSVKRRSLNNDEFNSELSYLLDQGYRTIELVGASDPLFTPEKIAGLISQTKDRLGEFGGGDVGLNFESANEEDYALYVKSGLDFVILWQETYHPDTYSSVHPAGTKKSNMDYRLNAYDKALEAGVKRVGLAFLGGLYDWKFELLSLFSHIKYLEKKYGKDSFIIGTPRWKTADGQIFKSENILDDDTWKFIASLYKIIFPNSLPWFSTREKFELSKDVINGGGMLFTLDCSTAVGGYTINNDFPQFPVFSKNISQDGAQWLKSQGYLINYRLPK